MEKHEKDTAENHARTNTSALPVAGAPVTEVEAMAIDREPLLIPENRRISWLGWIAAFLIFIVNRKIGIALFVILIVFRQFPGLNLKAIPGKAGRLFRKLRS